MANDLLKGQFHQAFASRGMPNVEKYAAGETTPVLDRGGKVSQVKAGYKPAFGAARCEHCQHFRAASDACELVEGLIRASDVCDLFLPERKDLTQAITEGYLAQVEKYGQPSDAVSPEKAREILRDGEANGRPLTKAQEGMFGAAAGRE